MLRIILMGLFGLSAVLAAPFAEDEIGLRVVNGTDSNIENYPYMVSLRRSTGAHTCGATLLSPNWVLTAAHCLMNSPAFFYSIQHSTTTIKAYTSANVTEAVETIRHPNFNIDDSTLHDIGLIREPVYVDRYAMIPPQFADVAHGTPSKLLGWGLEATGGNIQNTLQEVDLIVFSDEECRRLHDETIYPSQMCSGVPEGGRGQCSGDSGGPLLVNGIQVGIVSWSVKPCAVAPYPGVYTQVSYYREWIRQVTGI